MTEAFTNYGLSSASIANFLELGRSALGGLEICASLFAAGSIYHLRIVSMLVHGTGTKLAWNLCSWELCQFP